MMHVTSLWFGLVIGAALLTESVYTVVVVVIIDFFFLFLLSKIIFILSDTFFEIHNGMRSPVDDYMLATGSEDQTARLWDIRRSGKRSVSFFDDMMHCLN